MGTLAPLRRSSWDTMIIPNDLDEILSEIEKKVLHAQKLYISHELNTIEDVQKRAFKILVSAVISLRTKEKTTWSVSEKLYEKIHSWEELVGVEVSVLAKLLFPCGFYNRKAGQLKEIAHLILTKFQGEVPRDIDTLLTLPGVGRKVANLVVTEAFGEEGICVDIHVHRISNRWGLVNTQNPDETERVLRRILPLRFWKIYNKLLVQFGQTICLPVKPKCGLCFLAQRCEFANLK